MQRLQTLGACPKVGIDNHTAKLVGDGENAVIEVTTREGERLFLRVRDMTWLTQEDLV